VFLSAFKTRCQVKSDAESLKDSGYMEKAQLVDFVASMVRGSVKDCREWITKELDTLRPLLVAECLIIMPEGRKFRYLYSMELGVFLIAYRRLRKPHTQVSVVTRVDFLYDFFDEEEAAWKLLPPSLRDEDIHVSPLTRRRKSVRRLEAEMLELVAA